MAFEKTNKTRRKEQKKGYYETVYSRDAGYHYSHARSSSSGGSGIVGLGFHQLYHRNLPLIPPIKNAAGYVSDEDEEDREYTMHFPNSPNVPFPKNLTSKTIEKLDKRAQMVVKDNLLEALNYNPFNDNIGVGPLEGVPRSVCEAKPLVVMNNFPSLYEDEQNPIYGPIVPRPNAVAITNDSTGRRRKSSGKI